MVCYNVGMDDGGIEVIASVAVSGVGRRNDCVEVKRPEAAILAIERVAQGVSGREVERVTGLSHGVLARLRYDHREAIDARRARAADDAEEAAERFRLLIIEKANQLERDPEALAKINPKDLALGYGILRDKASNLRGDAVAVVEHRKGFSIEDAAEMIAAARKKVVNAEVIDV